MIIRVSRALVVCVLVVAGSWLVLTHPADAAKRASAGGLAQAPSHSSYNRLLGMRSRLGQPARSKLQPGRAHAAIVGGTEISIGQAPWQVAVEALIPEEGALFCGGSIIDESHILTAAHCVFDSNTGEVIPPEDFIVRAGVSNLALVNGIEEQERGVTDASPHPYYVYASDSGRVNPDDVAILTLERPLVFGPEVTPISVVAGGSSLPEGTVVDLAGFGQENPMEPLNGKLYSLGMTLGYARECGGENDAVLLCASGSSGTACNGDSGSALTLGFPSKLIGVVDDYLLVGGQKCSAGAEDAFANVAAPEIQDFIDGAETPPRAPRGGGAVIFEKPINDGSMGCEPGHWSGNPTFIYTFIDTDGQILQQGSSPTYSVPETELSHKILCQVQAVNAGGTGIGRTPGLSAIAAAPPPTQSSTEAGEHDDTIYASDILDVEAMRSFAGGYTDQGPERWYGSRQARLQGHGHMQRAAEGHEHDHERQRQEDGLYDDDHRDCGIFDHRGQDRDRHSEACNVAGRALLKEDRGRLDATLTIRESFVGSASTRREGVRLVLQKTHGAG